MDDYRFRVEGESPRLTLTVEEARELITDLYCKECGEEVMLLHHDKAHQRTLFACDCRSTDFHLTCVDSSGEIISAKSGLFGAFLLLLKSGETQGDLLRETHWST